LSIHDLVFTAILGQITNELHVALHHVDCMSHALWHASYSVHMEAYVD